MLKFNLESLDGLDDTTKALYKGDADSGYALQVSGAVPESVLNETKQKLVDATEEAVRRRKAVEKWKALGDSPDDVKSKLESKSHPDGDIIAQIKAERDAALEAANGTIKALRMDGVNSALAASLAEAGFHPEVITDIAAGAASRISLDDEGNPRIMSSDGKPMAGTGGNGYATISDLAKELAAAKPSFLVDNGKGGGGKPPASRGGNSSGQFGDISAKVPGFSTLPLK